MGQTWNDAKELLVRALELPTSARDAFVRGHCTDRRILEEVLDLLGEVGASGDAELLPSLPVLTEEPELASGTRIGSYTIIDTIATGGMGRVYLARDQTLRRKVAIKSLRGPEPHTASARSIIHREAQNAAQITSPNVATIHGFFEDNGRAFIVMEYVDGEPLSQVLKRGRLPIARVVEIGVQLATGLAAAHGKGVIHRDLKPGNIQLTADGTAKILDFGIASAKDPFTTLTGPTRLTHTGRPAAGTPGYMSPEQWRGSEIDERSDIFSLGLVLFEMVTGRRAWASSDPIDQRTPPLPRADAVDKDVSRRLADVIARAISIEPAQRFGSAVELREALERVQRQSTGLPAIARWLIGALALAGLCVALGYVSTTTFNVALERSDYVDATVWTWFNWGRRAVVAIVLVALGIAAVIGLLAVLRNVLLPMSTTLRSWDETICGRIRQITAVGSPVVASWIVLILAGLLALTWWRFAPYIDAMLTPVSSASVDQLTLLGPAHGSRRQVFEVWLFVLTIAATGAAVWIGRLRSAPGYRPLMIASWAIALLTLISSQLSYQFDLDSTRMPRVEWQGQSCYELGRRDVERLLCCPAAQPRLHRLQSSDHADVVDLKSVGHVYDAFR